MSEEVTSEPRVFMRHIRQAKLCSGGTRTWWKDNGLDWNDFLKNGIPGEVLLATGDPLAERPVQAARVERDGR
jgi:hypothetical protein